jgi:hypothetical protein
MELGYREEQKNSQLLFEVCAKKSKVFIASCRQLVLIDVYGGFRLYQPESSGPYGKLTQANFELRTLHWARACFTPPKIAHTPRPFSLCLYYYLNIYSLSLYLAIPPSLKTLLFFHYFTFLSNQVFILSPKSLPI